MGKGLGQMRGTVGWFRQTARQLPSSALAISELVKNSYDADASRVHLRLDHAFLPLDQKPWLEIRDNGHGMDIDDIRSRWSPIGDSKNREERLSPKGRVRQGGKGLGRLGAWRIGESVTIWTRKKGRRAIGLRYDLTGLDNGDPVESIKPVNVDADIVFKGNETGTVLRVGGFPERLTSPQNFCQKIHRELHLLPDPFSGLSDFEIQFTPPREVKKLQNLDLRELVEKSLYSADFVVTGERFVESFGTKIHFVQSQVTPLHQQTPQGYGSQCIHANRNQYSNPCVQQTQDLRPYLLQRRRYWKGETREFQRNHWVPPLQRRHSRPTIRSARTWA